MYIKRSGAPVDTDYDELIRLNDKAYYVTDKCNGCGLCEKVCPVHNIEMKDGKPVWLHHCENCLACYEWCPNRAIGGTIATKGHFYRHPELTVADMINQANG